MSGRLKGGQAMATKTENHLVASDPMLTWSPEKLTLQRNLAILVQRFQVDFADAGGISSPKAFILAPELVPYSTSADTDSVPEETIHSARNDIQYYDDVPCINGVPIYERLSGEPVPYYKLFCIYRDMKETSTTRSMVAVARETNLPMPVIQCLCKIWHWQARVIPFDRQLEIERDMQRKRQAQKLDGFLSKRSQDLIELAYCYLEEHENQLDPKMAIELLKTLVPIARTATGMIADKPSDAQGGIQFVGGSGGSGANVSVNVTNANANGTGNSVHGMAANEVIAKTEKQCEDSSHLAKILHVLQGSGAFERTILEQEGEVQDAEFTEVDE